MVLKTSVDLMNIVNTKPSFLHSLDFHNLILPIKQPQVSLMSAVLTGRTLKVASKLLNLICRLALGIALVCTDASLVLVVLSAALYSDEVLVEAVLGGEGAGSVALVDAGSAFVVFEDVDSLEFDFGGEGGVLFGEDDDFD